MIGLDREVAAFGSLPIRVLGVNKKSEMGSLHSSTEYYWYVAHW
jgi:hypothetical protein